MLSVSCITICLYSDYFPGSISILGRWLKFRFIHLLTVTSVAQVLPSVRLSHQAFSLILLWFPCCSFFNKQELLPDQSSSWVFLRNHCSCYYCLSHTILFCVHHLQLSHSSRTVDSLPVLDCKVSTKLLEEQWTIYPQKLKNYIVITHILAFRLYGNMARKHSSIKDYKD